MKKVESVNNQLIKELSKLHEKKHRDEIKKFLIEGYHLVDEAHQSGFLEQVLICDENDKVNEVENILVTESIIEKLSFTKSPQKIIGVCRYFEDFPIEGQRFLLLDNIQDPGNLGTLIRSALGFNIDMIILNTLSTDIYNDKVLRSSQGAIFKIKVIKKNLLDVIEILKAKSIRIFGTSVTRGIPLASLSKPESYALILGNEGNGINREILDKSDLNIFIETNQTLESLNVAVAGSIILYYLK